MKFISFTDENGLEVYVNATEVAAVLSSTAEEYQAIVVLKGGDKFTSTASESDILNALDVELVKI